MLPRPKMKQKKVIWPEEYWMVPDSHCLHCESRAYRPNNKNLCLKLHFYKLYIYLQWNPIVIPTNMDYGFRLSDHFIRLFVHSFVRSFVPERSCARQFRSFLLYCSYSFYFPHSNFSFSLFVLVLIFKAKQKRRRKKLQNFSRSSFWYQDQTNRFQASIEFINKSIDHDHHHHHH